MPSRSGFDAILVNSSGVPMTNISITVLKSDGTQATVYQAKTGNSIKAQPIITDSSTSGLIQFWADPGYYLVRATDLEVPARIATRFIPFDAVAGDMTGGIDVNQVSLTDQVSTTMLKNDSVTTAKIANLQVTTGKIADATVTTAKIADTNVTTDKIANLNVTTGKIADGAITTAKIGDGQVTTAKISGSLVPDGSVTSAKIVDGAVIESKLANTSVSNSKLANNSVNSDKLANTSVTEAKLASEAAAAAKVKIRSYAAGGTTSCTISSIPPGKYHGMCVSDNTGKDGVEVISGSASLNSPIGVGAQGTPFLLDVSTTASIRYVNSNGNKCAMTLYGIAN